MTVLPLEINPLIGGAGSRKVLLLQGPVGPFFGQLQNYLNANGIETLRICFHAADAFRSEKSNTLRFSGDQKEWRVWLRSKLSSGEFGAIILFGSERPAHRIARKLADQLDIRVLSLEEGYIRPGYITAEYGGNNANSPLAGQLPTPEFTWIRKSSPVEAFAGLRHMVAYGALYYILRGLMTHGKSRQLFHRRTPLVSEAWCWLRNVGRRVAGGERNFAIIQRLLEHADKRYYLVPLQVSADANLQHLAYGWTSARLVNETIQSFSRMAPEDRRLVFKIHPMERGHNTLSGFIDETAKRFGVSGRVDVIETGSLGLLTRHSAGMITINSTSGLSAIFHGVPLLVIGQALYAHEKLANCAHGVPDFDSFWTSTQVAEPALRRDYLAWVRQKALKPGDFYCPEGRKVAVHSVLERLQEPPISYEQIVQIRAAS